MAALAACSTLDVRTDSSAAADPTTCHSFSWLEPLAAESSAFGNPLNDKRLQEAVAQRLQARGMTRVASGSGDCIGSAYWDPHPPWYRRHRAAVDLYRTGSGPAGRQPLWHASVNLDLSQLTGAEAEKRIDVAVAAMFKTYPVTR